MLQVIFALRSSELKATSIGLRSNCKTLVLFRRIWIKLDFLKKTYDYLKVTNGNEADQSFQKIIERPGKAYVGGFASTARLSIEEYTIKNACKDFIGMGYSIQATVNESRRIHA